MKCGDNNIFVIQAIHREDGGQGKGLNECSPWGVSVFKARQGVDAAPA
jgi:hypothetical protein